MHWNCITERSYVYNFINNTLIKWLKEFAGICDNKINFQYLKPDSSLCVHFWTFTNPKTPTKNLKWSIDMLLDQRLILDPHQEFIDQCQEFIDPRAPREKEWTHTKNLLTHTKYYRPTWKT